jgi:hypothetical protein
MHTAERTYQNLLAPLGEEPAIWAECLFVDPVSDTAVLGAPDNQELSNEWEAYQALIEDLEPLRMADAETGPAKLLSLNNQWFNCRAQHNGAGLWLSNNAQPIEPGISGSPILNESGCAIGIVCTGSTVGLHGPNPRLLYHLPAWVTHPVT